MGDHDGNGTKKWKKIKTMIRFSQSESQLLILLLELGI